MVDDSKPILMDLIDRLKAIHGLKLFAASNEGGELTQHRIEKFMEMYFFALDCAQAWREKVAYIDDRVPFDVAVSPGIHGIQHTGIRATRPALEALGLSLDRRRAA
jgi:putative hydrolase of the HAD superfamily